MNLNRKVVEGSIVAGMLIVMTTTTSVTSQVVSNADTNTVSETIAVADGENHNALAGITLQMATVEKGGVDVSIEQADTQVVAASGAESTDVTAQTDITETLQPDVTRAMSADITDAVQQNTKDAQEIPQASEQTPENNSEEAPEVQAVNADVQTDAAVMTETDATDAQTQENVLDESVDGSVSSEAVVTENTANAIQSDAVTEQLKQEEAEWANRVMPSVNEYLNIRSAGDENAEIVGKLYKGDAAEIVERGDNWTHIKSGSVDGYVLNDYCAFGLDAYDLAKKDCQTEATVMTGGLRLRTEPNETSTVIDAVYEGQILTVDTEAESTEGWVAVEYDDQLAYVSAPYVDVDIAVGDAISIEEERAAQAAEAEKASQGGVATTQKEAVAASTDDVTLLAALIQLEAGSECYEGKVAVGAVVMNRVRSGSYPGSISGVVYQSGQFTTASSLAGVISSGVSGSCMQAAQEAINGTDNTGGCVSFRRASSGRAGVVIGNHVFF